MNSSLQPSIQSALVLAFASFGDAFLYAVLPLNALQMNVPVAWIGFLLSINRLVRLISNQLFAYLFSQFGFKQMTILAAAFAVLTTFSYGIATGITFWIIARIVWGFCFSALRISAISYSLSHKRQGLSLGLNRGLQEIGPIIALLAGPLLLKCTNPTTTFMIFAIASCSSVIISLYLPQLKYMPTDYNFSFNLLPSSFNLVTFLSAFFVQGILVVTITKLFSCESVSMIELTAIAATYLAYRRICTVIISPFGGILADKFGLEKVFIISLVFTIAGLFFIAIGFIKSGIIVAFTFNSITTALAPGHVVEGAENRLKTVAINSTWSDIGAATGALVAGSFFHIIHLKNMFFIATFALCLACIFHAKIIKFQTIELLKWK
jgi:MFS transporter, DHA1 family, multidrug resistance protein